MKKKRKKVNKISTLIDLIKGVGKGSLNAFAIPSIIRDFEEEYMDGGAFFPKKTNKEKQKTNIPKTVGKFIGAGLTYTSPIIFEQLTPGIGERLTEIIVGSNMISFGYEILKPSIDTVTNYFHSVKNSLGNTFREKKERRKEEKEELQIGENIAVYIGNLSYAIKGNDKLMNVSVNILNKLSDDNNILMNDLIEFSEKQYELYDLNKTEVEIINGCLKKSYETIEKKQMNNLIKKTSGVALVLGTVETLLSDNQLIMNPTIISNYLVQGTMLGVGSILFGTYAYGRALFPKASTNEIANIPYSVITPSVWMVVGNVVGGAIREGIKYLL